MRRKGKGDSHGPAGMMDCAGYGPCDVPGLTAAEQQSYRWYDATECTAVTPQQVLTRLCARMATDEPLYNEARRQFDERLRAAQDSLAAKVTTLQTAGAELSSRADAQALRPTADIEAESGVKLSRRYTQMLGGGMLPPHFPWWHVAYPLSSSHFPWWHVAYPLSSSLPLAARGR